MKGHLQFKSDKYVAEEKIYIVKLLKKIIENC